MTRDYDRTGPVDTMASFLETPMWRPRVTIGFGPTLCYIAQDGSQKALRLTERDLWDLGREVAEALMVLRSEPISARDAGTVAVPAS